MIRDTIQKGEDHGGRGGKGRETGGILQVS